MANRELRSSILAAIDQNLRRLEGMDAGTQRMRDLYGKNTPGDNYSKNTSAVLEAPEEVVTPAERGSSGQASDAELEARTRAVLERTSRMLGKMEQ